jgi:small GTP-binding protein
MVGDSAVGKTSIVSAFRSIPFNATMRTTLGAGSWKVERLIDGEAVVIDIWDTAGQDAFASLVPYYTRGASAVLLTFSLIDPRSFKSIPKWIEVVGEHGPIPCTVLLGNKADCERSVPFDDAMAFAESRGIRYFETSAKSGKGIEEALTGVMRALGGTQPSPAASASVNIDAPSQPSTPGATTSCC